MGWNRDGDKYTQLVHNGFLLVQGTFDVSRQGTIAIPVLQLMRLSEDKPPIEVTYLEGRVTIHPVNDRRLIMEIIRNSPEVFDGASVVLYPGEFSGPPFHDPMGKLDIPDGFQLESRARDVLSVLYVPKFGEPGGLYPGVGNIDLVAQISPPMVRNVLQSWIRNQPVYGHRTYTEPAHYKFGRVDLAEQVAHETAITLTRRLEERFGVQFLHKA